MKNGKSEKFLVNISLLLSEKCYMLFYSFGVVPHMAVVIVG